MQKKEEEEGVVAPPAVMGEMDIWSLCIWGMRRVLRRKGREGKGKKTVDCLSISFCRARRRKVAQSSENLSKSTLHGLDNKIYK